MFRQKRPVMNVRCGRPAPVLLLLCLLAWAAPAAASPVLVIDGNGKLTGATGVDVGGTLYDVTFVDGTCAAVFTGCDEASDFTFTDGPTVLTAAKALSDQVFLDGISGAFDSQPNLTFGCTFSVFCIAITPFQLSSGSVRSAFFLNSAINGASDVAALGEETLPADWGADQARVWAQWVPQATTPVPEPATLTLFGAGLAAARLAMRRRQRRPS